MSLLSFRAFSLRLRIFGKISRPKGVNANIQVINSDKLKIPELAMPQPGGPAN